MLWAIDKNEEKINPVPEREGICPLCKKKVIPKCGDVNIWHWAHLKTSNCDSWHEPETFWHLHWKLTFGKENTEVVINKSGKRHLADILTRNGVIIELQNSPIQKSIINEREEFYGIKMLWLINGNQFRENFEIKDFDERIKHINRHFEIIKEEKKSEYIKYFNWSYPRRSWTGANRNVFIDFGKEALFWVKEGIGQRAGNGIFVPKKDFIIKYQGNYDYYLQQFP